MPVTPRDKQDSLTKFIASLTDVCWLARLGEHDEMAIVSDNLVDAWDNWNSQMLAVWTPKTHSLEQVAVAELGEAGVDAIFEALSSAIDAPLRAAIARYFDICSTDDTGTDRGLWPEWLDSMKRDLSWAAVETVVRRPGFFTGLLKFYRAGRWPVAWEDGDLDKRVVLL